MIDTDDQGNVYRGVDACFFKAFNELRAKLLADFDKEWPLLLQEWDWASTRSYLAQGKELKFPSTVIDWIEKHKSGTGRYSRAVVEVSASFIKINPKCLTTYFRKFLNPLPSITPGLSTLIGGASKAAAKA